MQSSRLVFRPLFSGLRSRSTLLYSVYSIAVQRSAAVGADAFVESYHFDVFALYNCVDLLWYIGMMSRTASQLALCPKPLQFSAQTPSIELSSEARIPRIHAYLCTDVRLSRRRRRCIRNLLSQSTRVLLILITRLTIFWSSI